jgi:hypothetical protein
MDIVERLRKRAATWVSVGWGTNDIFDEAADEIVRLRGVLQQIADIEHEDIPAPKTPNEGVTWTVLAMAVGLAEKALKEGE